MKYKLILIIPGLPKTINQIGRTHWSVKMKEAKLWKNAVESFSIGKTPAEPLKKAKITLTRYSSHEIDSDNLVHSFKHVIDGLIQARIIENDKYSNIGMPEYKWEKVKPKEGFIKIELEEI